jgi:hypothetical protein
MRTWALRSFIGSIALSAIVGIYVILVGDSGPLEAKVLITALSVSLFSILGMSCGAAVEQQRLTRVAHLGSAAAALSFVLVMLAVWGWWWEPSQEESLMKWAASLALLAAAAALASLYALATLKPVFHWVRLMGYACVAALAVILVLMIWEAVDASDGKVERTLAVLAILVASTTIAIPVLHRMSRASENFALPLAALSIRFCVACGQGMTAAAGDEVVCAACGCRFQVQFRRPAE